MLTLININLTSFIHFGKEAVFFVLMGCSDRRIVKLSRVLTANYFK
nr:hypothetical protein [uncultured Chryseobacterium sp.]